MKQDDINDRLERAERELYSLRQEHHQVLHSASYRLAKLLVNAKRSPRKLIRLPVDACLLFRELRHRKKPPTADSSIYRQLQTAWQDLASQARVEDSPVVFLFSGTTFIQGTRGNRPIRQTQALLRQGAKVLFSYHRSRFDDPLPEYEADGLVQMPQDVTLQLLQEIASVDLGGCSRLFIVSYPYPGIEKHVELFRRQGWTVIYDCRDDWEEFAKVGMARWFDARVERALVRQCDRTICVSAPLVTKMNGLAPESIVELVPNAVEADFLPVDFQRVPVSPPVVGYFGHLSDAWFDWEAFIRIAEGCPQFRFEVIGHSAPVGLALPSNVQLLGPKPWDELYHYAAAWTVAIIPFRMGRLADGVDPIKIYEYLSFGLPVVSFLMPQIKDYPYTTTVDSVEAFCAALVAACVVEVDEQVLAQFIADNTWEKRAQQLLGFMGA